MVVGVTAEDGMTATEDLPFDDDADNASEGDRQKNTTTAQKTRHAGTRRHTGARRTQKMARYRRAQRRSRGNEGEQTPCGHQRRRGVNAAPWRRGGVAGRVEGGTPSHGRLPAPHPCAQSRTAAHSSGTPPRPRGTGHARRPWSFGRRPRPRWRPHAGGAEAPHRAPHRRRAHSTQRDVARLRGERGVAAVGGGGGHQRAVATAAAVVGTAGAGALSGERGSTGGPSFLATTGRSAAALPLPVGPLKRTSGGWQRPCAAWGRESSVGPARGWASNGRANWGV